MQEIRRVFVLSMGVLALSGGMAMGQKVRSDAKPAARQVEREFDPDAGSEAPFDAVQYEGEVAGADACEAIGAFTSQFQFAARYRGNLYRITDLGVFLKEIKMQLAFTGVADLFVSVHRKMSDGSYEEVDINPGSPTQGFAFVSDAPGLGNTTSAFYSSGLLNGDQGIELTPGDYAIGFAWGSESIKFGRDVGVTYPRAIEVGSTLASVSRELPQSEPPLPATLASLTQFTGGAYSQQLCFVPARGACCLASSQACADVFEEECVGEGSFFHGQRTSCEDTICEFGACCFDCGSAAQNFTARCGDHYVQESCDLAGGLNFWSGVSCPADESVLCPKLVGACCNGTTCNLRCKTECLAGGGSYEGDGTSCDPNTHKCKGACCVTGGCVDRTQSGCTGSNGTFKGRGTRCFSEVCGGACCYGFTGLDFCEEYSERTLCAYDPEGFPHIAYRGDGTECEDADGSLCGTIDQYKACCLPEGTCINTTQAVCTAPWIQGNFISTGTCATIAPNQCTNLLSRCCFNDGACEVLTGNSCTARGGTTVVGQTTCVANACNSTAGACCGTTAGDCSMTTAAQCDLDHGFYQGDTSDCLNAAGTCPGFGACCRENGECLENQTQSQCTIVGGAYGGAGTTCATQECDQNGACCAVTGTCLLTTASNCAGIDGDFKGVGEPCVSDACTSGACCLPIGCCQERTPAACAVDGGEYRGESTTCGSESCTIRGGCCRGTSCAVETPEECAVNDGTYLGACTGCADGICVIGSCCRITGTCDEGVRQTECVGPGEVFHAGLACTDPGVQCTLGACCTGASCTDTTEANCSGEYQDGVLCNSNPCAVTGSCCRISDVCDDGVELSGCAGPGDDFHVGLACLEAQCTQHGACCNGIECTTATLSACSSGGGEYKGDDSSCATNPCQTGTVCTELTGSVPADCAVDARRPHAPGAPGTLQTTKVVVMTFADACTAQTGDFTATCTPTVAPCPTVSTVDAVDATITVTLSSEIPAGNWTCVEHTASGSRVCVGSLPGDCDGGLFTAPADIIKLIDNLNGQVVPPLAFDHCDLDRSGLCRPPDIITLIDMLNGNGFIVWNGKSLPACPSTP